ncbi:MAG TPA: Asp-tRNA(Asn)/Glu-tRNA(Gln) amidotransferase subunit GatC [Arcobacter sp.]|nr:Asp-tRNA(Asn)/Glu-tRNA(Gln) amidotransferase subunit GatC [Arcobacter sp.]HIP55873.1 Asp-tRNA(Asn)/Glu-tRNA(Gln) amidotransferase subunit GatC [Arcobacter sp.]
MTIDDKTIDKLAKLSSLEISNERKEELKTELADIVTFVENLNEVDVSSVEATFTTIQGGQLLREDEVQESKEMAEAIMKNAPKVEDNHFIVPQIIE